MKSEESFTTALLSVNPPPPPPYDEIIQYLTQGTDVFLTGGAGVGKTYATYSIINDIRIHSVNLGSTGGAASLLPEGMTVHRFLKLGIARNVKELRKSDHEQAVWTSKKMEITVQAANAVLMNNIAKVLRTRNCLIIDEVSMLSADFIKMIKYRLIHCLKIEVPILWVGDFFQLPPVDKEGKENYAFFSEHWTKVAFELTKIQRTKDLDFAKFLNNMRLGEFDPDSQPIFDQLTTNPYKEDAVHLFSTNQEINAFNIQRLLELPGEPLKTEFKFKEKYKKGACIEFIERDLSVLPVFCFKIGARVIFTSNQYLDDRLLWYNGEGGHIKSIRKGYITVTKECGREVDVPRVTFSRNKVTKSGIQVEIEIEQFPLRIGYAISIHKSQGMSLSSGHIDCTNFFLTQQPYVAISRFIDPSKLSLSNFDKSMISKNQVVLNYYNNANLTKLT